MMEAPIINLKCSICNSDFARSRSEYKRSQRLKRPSYCSRSCSGHANRHSLGKHFGKGNVSFLVADNRRDKYTPFKWFIKGVERRNKNRGNVSDIDLEFLSNLWESQSGVCPLTGWKLELPKHSCGWKTKQNKLKRASLDRIDNSKGYIKGNIRFISVMANYCKNTFTDDDVKLFCEAVYHNQMEKVVKEKLND